MSSTASKKKLKRSKTTHVSFSTSISGGTASAHQAKVIHAMDDVTDGTQITTPRAVPGSRSRDVWEVPSSDVSHGSPELRTKRHTPKTYGKPIRRTQTFAPGLLSPQKWPALLEPSEAIDHLASRSSNADEITTSMEDALPLPQPNRFNQQSRTTSGTAVHSSASNEHSRANEGKALLSEDQSTTTVEVPRTAETVEEDLAMLPPLPPDNNLSTSTSSIVVIANTLTEEQKSQYALVQITSSAQSQALLLDMTDHSDHVSKDVEESGNLHNGAIVPVKSSQNIPTPRNSVPPSSPASSPRFPTGTRRRKRAVSDVASPEPSAPVNQRAKRLRRNKTVNYAEAQFLREPSIDELSQPPLAVSSTSTANLATMETPKAAGRARSKIKQKPNENQQGEVTVLADQPASTSQVQPSTATAELTETSHHGAVAELLGTDETFVQKSSRKSKAKVRRTKSMFVRAPNESDDEDPIRSVKKARTRKVDYTEPTIDELALPAVASSQGVSAAEHIHRIGALLPQLAESASRQGSRQGSVDKTAEAEPAAPAPTQPKKRGRGRKKTSENVEKEIAKAAEIHAAEQALAEEPPPALQEADPNRVPEQAAEDTAPIDDAVEHPKSAFSVSPQKQQGTSNPHTPEKKVKKGPDQHSPLQSGKIPHRVGLSKRVRIAPLLKVIRKTTK
jgi:hypothetical protein